MKIYYLLPHITLKLQVRETFNLEGRYAERWERIDNERFVIMMWTLWADSGRAECVDIC